MPLHHLTDDELIRVLQMRNDLTEIEHELLDRLTRMQTAMRALEADFPSCGGVMT